jgi:cell division septal protein FtsQ
MWFNRKPKNRRLAREFVLDVKLRSSQVRTARMRLAASAVAVAFATLLGLFLIWRLGEWSLTRLVYENHSFAIREIDVQTDGVIAIDQLRRWAGVKLEDNLLALDLGRVKRDLELVPLIQSASVERILPHTLRLRITEREPIAQINVPHPNPSGGVEWTTFHVDPEGYVMLPLDFRQRAALPNQAFEQFPVLSGINPNDLQPGRRVEAGQLQAALQLIVAFAQSPMAGLVDFKKIDVSAPEVLLVTTGQGSEVTFGLSDPDQQLRRWREIFDLGQKLNRAVATLDLAVSNNIPARWLEASLVPPIPAKAPKPLRNKKKHV